MKLLLKVTSFTALLTLVRMASGFVIAKVVAVYAGPTGLAMLGQVQSLIGVLTGIANAPIGSGVIRYTAENKESGLDDCAPWWRAAVQWLLALLLISMVIGVVLASKLSLWLFQNPDYAWLIVLISLTLPVSAMGTLVNSVLNGRQDYQRFVLLGILSTLFSSVSTVLLIVFLGLEGALLGVSIQTGIIGFVLLAGACRQPWFKLKYWFGKIELIHKKAIGGYVLMAVASALTGPVSLMLVRDLLVGQVGWNDAGHWQAVWKISEVYLGVITIALGTYFLPKLSSLKTSYQIRQEINATIKIILPIICFMAIAIYLLRDVAILILFTSDFLAARDLFFVQLIGDVVKIVSWLYAFPMLSRGATKWFIGSELIFSCMFVFLAWLFIPIHGSQGANFAYLVNYLLYFLFVYFNFNKFSK